jgi:streptogrisin D
MRNSSGTTYLLTAAHCSTTQPLFDNAGELIGGVYRQDWRYDVLLVNARGMYWIFDGTPTTSFHKAVRIYGYPVVNQLLCQSGATSGTICGLQTVSGVYSFGLCDSDGDCFTVYDMNRAYQINGQTATRRGDSGGPVFSLHGDGVQAKGIVNGFCGSYGSNCMYFQDFATVSNLFSVYPRTG